MAKLLGARVVLQNPEGRFTGLADVTIVVPEDIDPERLADDLTAIYSLVLPWPASRWC